MNNLDESAKFSSLCLERDPDNARALQILGRCLLDKKEFKKAEELLEKSKIIQNNNE